MKKVNTFNKSASSFVNTYSANKRAMDQNLRLSAWNIFNNIFTVFCIVITTTMAGFWLYKFSLNEDLCTLDYKYYHESKDDVYPSISICFKNPFKSTVSNGTEEGYEHLVKNYLSGKLKIKTSYDVTGNLTFDLTEYLVTYWVMWKNGSDTTYKPSEYPWRTPYVSYAGFWSENFYKCFAVQIPDKDIREISIKLPNKIFPNATRPTHWGFLVLFHYPNQLLLPSVAMKYIWPPQTKRNDYSMRFYAQNLEIFRRRKNCHDNWTNYDNDLIEHHRKRIGCRPLYDISKHNLPLCTDKQQIQEFASILSLDANHEFPPPCKAMEKISYENDINDLIGSDWESHDHFWCTFIMQESRFKVRLQNLLLNI